jgi:hypothetical protein
MVKHRFREGTLSLSLSLFSPSKLFENKSLWGFGSGWEDFKVRGAPRSNQIDREKQTNRFLGSGDVSVQTRKSTLSWSCLVSLRNMGQRFKCNTLHCLVNQVWVCLFSCTFYFPVNIKSAYLATTQASQIFTTTTLLNTHFTLKHALAS